MAPGQYEYLLATGSGSETISLTFEDEHIFRGSVQNRWMTDESWRCEFAGVYQQVSDAYGWMRIQEIQEIPLQARSSESNGAEIPVGVVDTPLVCEYLNVPHSSVRFHPDPDIDAMYGWGVTRWNEEFDLVIIISPHVLERLQFLLDEGPTNLVPNELASEQYDDRLRRIERLLFALDKKKLHQIT